MQRVPLLKPVIDFSPIPRHGIGSNSPTGVACHPIDSVQAGERFAEVVPPGSYYSYDHLVRQIPFRIHSQHRMIVIV